MRTIRTKYSILIITLLSLLYVDNATAEEEKTIDVSGKFQNLLLFKTDSDFDKSPPKYNESGQTVGILGTYIRPDITLHLSPRLMLFYQGELGLNLWSKNNVEQGNPGADDALLFKHRELWGAISSADERLRYKMGYQFLNDTTGLFVAHWLGAGRFIYSVNGGEYALTLAQVPDQTYEGIDIDKNNFKRDVFLLSFAYETVPFKGGLFGLYDASIIHHEKWLLSPCIQLSTHLNVLSLGADGVFQYGITGDGAFKGEDEIHMGWASQLWSELKFSRLTLSLNLLALSPDDEFDHNGRNYAFHYSGKSRSRTHILSEDELYDRGGNLDEGRSEAAGQFFITRAGLILLDISMDYAINRYFSLCLTIGDAYTLERENAYDNDLIGIEGDVDLKFTMGDNIVLNIINGVLVPGGAGSASVNAIDPDAKDPLYFLETSLAISF